VTSSVAVVEAAILVKPI